MRIVFFLFGLIFMNSAYSEKFFDVFEGRVVELYPVALIGISNALAEFKETNQPLENFSMVMENEEGGIILISFMAKLKPGMKGLGNANRIGRGITYRISIIDGSILSFSYQK